MGWTRARQRPLKTTLPINDTINAPSTPPRRSLGQKYQRPGERLRRFLVPLSTAALVLVGTGWTVLPSASQQRMRRAQDETVYPPRILTIYTQPATALTEPVSPDRLLEHAYPNVQGCSHAHFPIDDFPDDPYLPWIHDWFVLNNSVQIIAQNKRRCETGEGKESIMRYWEPQMALFQRIGVDIIGGNNVTAYRIADPSHADVPSTRFVCRFTHGTGQTSTTLSHYPFDYEYVNWRKRRAPMYRTEGRDVEQFEFSTLLVSCPIPDDWTLQAFQPSVWLDLVPIRVPPRRDETLLTIDQVGPDHYRQLKRFNVSALDHLMVPDIANVGRWSNLAICGQPVEPPRHYFVACTWTADDYQRRGNGPAVNDTADRLREWLVFHRLVGVDHVYVYDNSRHEGSLKAIADEFGDFVTYIPWPATVCSNNRPNHANPGERSSQYAAEASCREQFGPYTEWMTFLDTDEYLVPLAADSWRPILEQYRANETHVLKFRSSRGRPRWPLMQEPEDTLVVCKNPSHRREQLPVQPCLVKRPSVTYLRLYNCDYIRPPRPERFARAMKQIYQPAFVQSHFVHYSTVTRAMTRPYSARPNQTAFFRSVQEEEWGDAFVDDVTEGILMHTKSVLPYETATRNATCHLGSHHSCQMGVACPASTKFVDAKHQKNEFVDEQGRYCNCWINEELEHRLLPQLDQALAEHARNHETTTTTRK